MKLLQLDKKYVVACSFGPDSMALLDMMVNEGYDVVVAHVNYHKRDVSNFEEFSLKFYCKDHNIPIEVLDTGNMIVEGNFQDWARNVRYEFFAHVVEQYDADAVVVAHHQDDLLETYFMQKNRRSIVKYWGIAEKTMLKVVKILRPLLAYSKKDLMRYVTENSIPYSIDESNLRDDYTRNKIRHEIVEKLTDGERAKILEEIDALNSSIRSSTKTSWNVSEFLELPDRDIVMSISNYLESSGEHKNISKAFVREIRKAFSSKKKLVEISLLDSIFIIKDYDQVLIFDESNVPNYKFSINADDEINNELFHIIFHKGENDRNITDNDYPLIVKPVDPKERFRIRHYQAKINRLFIDWKMPHRYRKCWPGIYNKDGKLIYIPRYRKEFVDEHSSKFYIKFIH